MDYTDLYFDWMKKSKENRKIGPIGFIILSIGFVFQFIGQVIEMTIK